MKKVSLENVVDFLEKASSEDLYILIEEIRGVHKNLIVFDRDTRSVKRVIDIKMNQECIQLDVESWNEKEDAETPSRTQGVQ